MFIDTEPVKDNRPKIAVCSPEFLHKYFEREFNLRVTANISEADFTDAAIVVRTGDLVSAEESAFIAGCHTRGIPVVTLRTPVIIGTGMGDPGMALARGLARGTLCKIRDNEARWSVIHAVDIAKIAKMIADTHPSGDTSYIVSAPPVAVNDLIEALATRIKNRKVATIKRGWAKLLFGKKMYPLVTSDSLTENTRFTEDYPEYSFINPVEYLTTHNYDDESL